MEKEKKTLHNIHGNIMMMMMKKNENQESKRNDADEEINKFEMRNSKIIGGKQNLI